jgi:hypothetical protein
MTVGPFPSTRRTYLIREHNRRGRRRSNGCKKNIEGDFSKVVRVSKVSTPQYSKRLLLLCVVHSTVDYFVGSKLRERGSRSNWSIVCSAFALFNGSYFILHTHKTLLAARSSTDRLLFFIKLHFLL